MVDVILGTDQPVARRVEVELAWMRVLATASGDELANLAPPRPRDGDSLEWLPLAQRIAAIHAELAGEQRSFTHAADVAGTMEMLREADRWNVLTELYGKYQRLLGEAGLVDPDEARRVAIENPLIRPRGVQQIVLIGVADLNAVQRAAIAASGLDSFALVHAPESRSSWFDELGCVRSDCWLDAHLNIEDESIRVVDRPESQAQAVLDCIAEGRSSIAAVGGANASALAADEITIGLGDESLAGAIERAGRWAGHELRSFAGRELATSPPLLLLARIAAWLTDSRFLHFADLIRHPDLEQWLLRQGVAEQGMEDWISLLDRYFADTLQERLSGLWLGRAEVRHRLGRVHDAVQSLLEPLRGDVRPLGEWGHPLVQVLNAVYEARLDHRELNLQGAIEQVVAMLGEVARIPLAIQPNVAAPAAIRFLMSQAAEARIPEPLEDDQIEMLGWLELHLDPAPILIVAGVNDGSIPCSLGADLFLPNALRARLGLVTADRLCARDAYLLEAILHSRKRCTLISGRRDINGEPLTPSRLLLACDDTTLVARVRAMSAEIPSERRAAPRGVKSPAARSAFDVPALPANLAAPISMRITDFALYLACPYRYALHRLAGLEAIQIGAAELDPMAFGSLAHDVLCDFGQCRDVAHSTDDSAIEAFLIETLRRKADETFGESLSPPLRVQLARMEQRFRDFATFQARQRLEGWTIEHCEVAFDGAIALDIPGAEPMPLRGKIDRIDYNQSLHRWRVLDYKTGDAGKSPIQAHHQCKAMPQVCDEMAWCDLQLPLYRYLVLRSTHGISDPVELGYIVLPKQSGGTSLQIADWTEQHLVHAENEARRVVTAIRSGAFAINPEFDGRFDPFSRICQSTVLRGEEDEAEEGDEL